jgi:hypothetical protein
MRVVLTPAWGPRRVIFFGHLSEHESNERDFCTGHDTSVNNRLKNDEPLYFRITLGYHLSCLRTLSL